MISKKDAVRPSKVKVAGLLTFEHPKGLEKLPHAVAQYPHTAVPSSADYHNGPTRIVRPHESTLISGQEVWNERALSICLAQELIRIAEDCGLTSSLSDRQLRSIVSLGNLWGIYGNEFRAGSPEDIKKWHISLMAAIVGCNIILDDPDDMMRDLMGNGNVISFISPNPSEEPETAEGASIIVSSYNRPCGKPFKRAQDMIGSSSPDPINLRSALELRRGWLAGVYSGGYISYGDIVEVNVAPTTPDLPA